MKDVVSGQGGLPCLRINAAAASAEIYLHGAHLTSWRPAGAEEVMFLSEESAFADGKAIRGGIPVCFPWFRNKLDDPKAPSHGTVRTREWKLDSVVPDGDTVTVTLSTESDASTLAWWPFPYHLVHRLRVGKVLEQELVMTNPGDKPLRFEEALHTYYRVGDASKVSIVGLDGVTYMDNTDGNKEKRQEGNIVFTAQTDRAYMNTTHAVDIVDPVMGRRIRVTKQDSRSTVVWNPWSTGAQTMADLGNDEWRIMTCVEASNMRACGVDLAAGATHTMRTRIELL
jgi:glucose-6-phosphate 1-epimerase